MYAQQQYPVAVSGPFTDDPGVFVGAPNDPHFHEIRKLGWRWTPQGAFLYIDVNGAVHTVHVPIGVIHDIFDHELGAVGCPLATGYAVGEPVSVGGFFSRLKRAFRKATKAVTGAVRKAASAVNWVAQKAVRPVVRLGSKVLNNSVLRTVLGNIPIVSTYYGMARTALNVADKGLAFLNNPSLKNLGRIATSGLSSAAGMIPGGNAVMQVAEMAAPALTMARSALGPSTVRAVPAQLMRNVWGGTPRMPLNVPALRPSLQSYGWGR